MSTEEPDKVTFKHVFTHQHNHGRIDDFYKFEKKKGALGEGSYGKVFKGEHREMKGTIRAIKVIDMTQIKDPKRFQQEVDIQKQLDHPNIVKLYEVFQDAKKIYLVMELCTGGELFDRIVEEAEKNAEGQAFDERGAASYMQQILGAMRYLHSKEFVHRDIKPENFLLANKNADAPIKVIDFGLAKQFSPGKSDLMKTKAGTPYYVAPQVLQGKYDEKCDIWSCGVIAYILLCGYPPFYGDKDEEILRRVKAGNFDFPSPDWDDISKAGKDIITAMLTKDADKRPSASELLDHAWLETNAAKPTGTMPKNLSSNLKNFTGVSKLKKVALTLIAQQLNEKEIEDLKNTFHLLDKNKDGTLSIQEMMDAFQKHNADTFDETMRETLLQLDTDGSGCIDYTEFIAATIDRSKYLKRDVLWAAFRTFDKDGNGSITKEELKVVLQNEEVRGFDDFIQKIFTEVDLDGDGTISFEEFVTMMEKPSTSVAL